MVQPKTNPGKDSKIECSNRIDGEVGTPEEEDAFEALRNVIVAEARRINGLMYCARLRCGIMPTRFEVLRLSPASEGYLSVPQHEKTANSRICFANPLLPTVKLYENEDCLNSS